MEALAAEINAERRKGLAGPMQLSPYLTSIAQRRMAYDPEDTKNHLLYSEAPGVLDSDNYTVKEMGDILLSSDLGASHLIAADGRVELGQFVARLMLGIRAATNSQWLKLMNPEQTGLGIGVSAIRDGIIYVEIISYSHP